MRLGVIHAEFPNQADSEGLLGGAPAEYGCLPVSTSPVDFDVIAEVTLTDDEFDGLILNSDKTLGWLNPGVLPVHRVQSVQFSSMDLMERIVGRLNGGPVVPDVLKEYQSNWSVNESKEVRNEEVVASLLNLVRAISDANEIIEVLKKWESIYGQLSFLRSVVSPAHGRLLGSNAINHIVPKLISEKTWPELHELYAECKASLIWSESSWVFKALNNLGVAASYAKGDDDAPEKMGKALKEGLGGELGTDMVKLWESCDCWNGKRLAENSPLIGPIDGITDWLNDDKYPLEVRTDAILVLSKRALRLDLGDNGEENKMCRTRNLEEHGVIMTSMPSDGMNNLIAECSWCEVKEVRFDVRFWSGVYDKVDTGDVINREENVIVLFGMRLVHEGIGQREVFLRNIVGDLQNELNEHRQEVLDMEGKLKDKERMIDSAKAALNGSV